MKTILLFGAGKSATVLIDYFISEARTNDWKLIVADANKQQIISKTNKAACSEAVEMDINSADQRRALIEHADIVISMMPPALHFLIARDSLSFGKDLLTASYLDEQTRSLSEEIKEKQLIFLYEMGLDPGIDHMSAMKIIHEIREKGGKIISFKSHCGGLIAPESDNNPWHYKISWNPRNIVLAGKAGAQYKQDGQLMKETYSELFKEQRQVFVNEETNYLSWYPNRDSLGYIGLYGLQNTSTFLRTTLRHPDFMHGWNHIVNLRLTDEAPLYDSNGMSLALFFKQHFAKHNFRYNKQDDLLLSDQLLFLGLEDEETTINNGLCSAADVLQFAMEKKLSLFPDDKDMIIMLHEFEYELNEKLYRKRSILQVKGEDSVWTAMATTVGLPLGIAAKLILNGTIQHKGLLIPTTKEIYNPVLKELQQHGISFKEDEQQLT